MLPWGPVCRGRFDRAKQNCSVGTLLEPSIKPNQNLRCEVHEKVINTATEPVLGSDVLFLFLSQRKFGVGGLDGS